jgi:hypothetical protein
MPTQTTIEIGEARAFCIAGGYFREISGGGARGEMSCNKAAADGEAVSEVEVLQLQPCRKNLIIKLSHKHSL